MSALLTLLDLESGADADTWIGPASGPAGKRAYGADSTIGAGGNRLPGSNKACLAIHGLPQFTGNSIRSGFSKSGNQSDQEHGISVGEPVEYGTTRRHSKIGADL